jgi:hypothetical protein
MKWKMQRRRNASGSFFVVRRDDHDRPLACRDLVTGLDDGKPHLVELAKQIVGKFHVCLVDLVDQQHVTPLGREDAPERAHADVVANVRHVAAAETAVVEALHGIVDVEALSGLGRRLHVPALHRHGERICHMTRQQGFAGARLSLNEQRPLERERTVDGVDQRLGGDVAGRAGKAAKVLVGDAGGHGNLRNCSGI